MELDPNDLSALFLIAGDPISGPKSSFNELLPYMNTTLGGDIARIMVGIKPESEYSREDFGIMQGVAIECLTRVHNARIGRVRRR